MTLSVNECEEIVCKITNSFCEKEGIQLPKEVTDYIQNILNKEGAKHG